MAVDAVWQHTLAQLTSEWGTPADGNGYDWWVHCGDAPALHIHLHPQTIAGGRDEARVMVFNPLPNDSDSHVVELEFKTAGEVMAGIQRIRAIIRDCIDRNGGSDSRAPHDHDGAGEA